MGRGARERFWRNMAVAIVVGLLCAAAMGGLFYFLYNR
jgi:Mg/Co/Ni transporter MgtE